MKASEKARELVADLTAEAAGVAVLERFSGPRHKAEERERSLRNRLLSYIARLEAEAGGEVVGEGWVEDISMDGTTQLGLDNPTDTDRLWLGQPVRLIRTPTSEGG